MTFAEWKIEGERKFGSDTAKWAFECPACHFVQTVEMCRAAGVPEASIGFSCIGRWSGAKREAFTPKQTNGPCNYAGGGLFRINPVRVEFPDGMVMDAFAFA